MSRPMRVLIAEDQSLVAMVLEHELQRLGVEVLGPYETVEDVLGATRRHKLDAAILDVNLRDGEIYPAADALIRQGVQIIFHTGYNDAYALKARYPSAWAFTKPVTKAQLIEALSQAHRAISTPKLFREPQRASKPTTWELYRRSLQADIRDRTGR